MKTVMKTTMVIALTLILSAFTSLTKKQVDIKESNITWKGYKVTGEHFGTITLKEGTLVFDGKKLVDGNFVMDMKTINATDLEGEWKDKLDGHLKSEDFFGVEKNPTATLDFTNVKGNGNSYTVTANLTIKKITHPITFTLDVDGNTATTSFKIDRTKYDIKYGSASFFDDLKDKAIYDEFDLNATLKF